MTRLPFLLFALAITASAQAPQQQWGPDVIPNAYTVATLPTSIARTGLIVRIVDAQTNTDCSAGGGSVISFCYFNGSGWSALNIQPAFVFAANDTTLNFIGKQCVSPSLGWASDGSAGHKLIECDSTNTWNFVANDAAVVGYGNGAPGVNACIGGIGGALKFFYVDNLTGDIWECGSPYKKLLSTTNSGTFSMTVQNGADPCGTVGAGLDCLFFNASDQWSVKNSSGGIANSVMQDVSGNASIAGDFNAGGTGTFGAGGNGRIAFPSTGGSPVIKLAVSNMAGGTQTPADYSGTDLLTLAGQVPGSTDALGAATINTTETAFATVYAIPASYFGHLGKALRVTWAIEETTSGTPVTQRIRVRLGGLAGTVAYDSGVVTPTASLALRTATFQCIIGGTAAAGASVAVESTFSAFSQVDTAGTAIVTPFGVVNTIAQPVSVATNAGQSLAITIQFGGNTAANSIRIRQMYVEEIGL